MFKSFMFGERGAVELLPGWKVNVERIDPPLAEQYLKLNKQNRSIRSTAVDTYATAMRRGEWKLTHQGICFDETGALLDGQHRLAAIIESGVSVDCVVFRGCPPETFHYVDDGAKRTAGDALGILGDTYCKMRAAIARILCCVNQDTWQGPIADRTVTTNMILDFASGAIARRGGRVFDRPTRPPEARRGDVRKAGDRRNAGAK